VNEVQGWNSRLDPLQAAVLRAKLPYLDAWNARRGAIAARYAAAFADADLVLPGVPAWADPAWHLFVVRVAERERLQSRLAAAGVGTLIHYPLPPHRQAAYRDLGLPASAFPLANQLADQVLSLPIGPQQDDRATQAVIDAVRACL
jgi:dTDP-4-amino-4,6-dideoxygalactose transaminase